MEEIKLKPGKFYRTRDGRKVKCERYEGSFIRPYLCGDVWYLQGGARDSYNESPIDIIAEWEE